MARTLVGDVAATFRSFRNLTPVSFAPPGSGRGGGLISGLARPAGQEAQMRAMGSSSTLYSIVDRIITALAEVEWHLYRSAKSGKDEDRVEVTSHAALDLWRNPNPFMTGPQFVETAQQHEELTGEQWWVFSKHERASLPLEIWPVRPDRMEPVPDPQEFLTGYLYRSPSGETVPLDKEDVIFQRRPNPIDPYRGMGVVQTLLIDLDATRASAEWNAAFFRNSAQPGGIVEVDRRLDDWELDEFRTRWAEQHRGVHNAHRVGVLENGLKWVDRKYTMQEMQFSELRAVGREIIREAFGFPKPMMGATDDVNRANAEAAEVVFARWLIKPRLERIRQVLNTRLLPMYGATGRGLEFDFDNPVPDDREADAKDLTAKVTAAKTLIDAGFEPVSVREALGLPEMETSPAVGGDGTISPRELGDMIQSIYLGVDRCITWEEAREILNRAGAGLSLGVPAPSGPAPAALSAPGAPPVAPDPVEGEPEDSWRELVAGLTGDGGVPEVEAAMRWEAVAKIDDNTCEACDDNDGHLYRNRAAAFKDYPGGSGYVKCTGAEYGNECRCKVVKRRKTEDDE